MGEKYHQQMPLMDLSVNHPHAEDYERISAIFDDLSIINEMVLQDVTRRIRNRSKGAEWGALRVSKKTLTFQDWACYLPVRKEARPWVRISSFAADKSDRKN